MAEQQLTAELTYTWWEGPKNSKESKKGAPYQAGDKSSDIRFAALFGKAVPNHTQLSLIVH